MNKTKLESLLTHCQILVWRSDWKKYKKEIYNFLKEALSLIEQDLKIEQEEK